MTSSIFPLRSERGPWAPSTHATASTRLDFPEPFGPTTTVTPGSKSSVVFSAKDLKPLRVSDLRNILADRSDEVGQGRGGRVETAFLMLSALRSPALQRRARPARPPG